MNETTSFLMKLLSFYALGGKHRLSTHARKGHFSLAYLTNNLLFTIEKKLRKFSFRGDKRGYKSDATL